MNRPFGQRTAFWGITYRELMWAGVFYLVSVLMYDVALSLSERSWAGGKSLIQVQLEYLPQILINYLFKILLTLPTWWLFFRKLAPRPLERKAWLHLAAAPLHVYLSLRGFYAVADAFGIGHLEGYGQVWDLYISLLFYILQFGIFHAYSYHQNLQRQQKLEAELRQAALQSELAALKAQINPHFLYNTFNTISASVPPELEHTRELLAELADMFRYQLRATKTDFVTVREEVDFAKKYLDLEKARFGDRLRVDIHVAPDAADAKIPPMILQPLVENSVKHGIASLIEGGEVRINVLQKNGALLFEISDTGVGMNHSLKGSSPAESEGIGLKNTQLRLEKMLGAQLRISQNQPRGTKIEFEIKQA
ncbi:sensor histidine kinase [Runella slithyformis]|uniref:Signal transduction histidine kinase n=1 Tax=Runella slithyformis (strain ATCC 29530 / DSM 19594 / LMG 11500 / NCIMB 11436 / LSU 4) TaxID=761193 RepID=A0A7U4E8X3_RUNSL|nr:histidine kinase [Runella slithyformis]AEI51924.1 putative signal transduction histidine kinase [Runella slithyformis DSM 19594]